jgi:hydroxyacylglutathione hydrolase
MNASSFLFFLSCVFLIFLFQCSQTEDLIIKQHVTGPVDANCYLIFCTKTKEAALIDIAGPIDTLLAYIKENNLTLRYFFFTHGHFDHVMGLPEIRDQFPDAKVCIYKDDYDDMLVQLDWVLNNMKQGLLDNIKSDPKLSKLLEFDAATFGKPDIFIEDNQIFNLGHLKIKAIHSPGHSRGSVCFNVGNSLFTGDVLFYRTVGRTDVQNSSRKDQIKSVKKLYELFPDSTIVYPGHGRFTDIGSEKNENKYIRIDGGEWIDQ